MDTLDNGGEERGRPFGHVANLAPSVVTAKLAIETARDLLAPGARNKDLPAILFDNRVAPFTVRAWRMGMRAMPAWARELLTHKIELGARRYAHAAAIARRCPIGPGQMSDATGAHFRKARQS